MVLKWSTAISWSPSCDYNTQTVQHMRLIRAARRVPPTHERSLGTLMSDCSACSPLTSVCTKVPLLICGTRSAVNINIICTESKLKVAKSSKSMLGAKILQGT